ncbi:hypothetical protein DFH06DRAFT_261453 [Mycena polygramma]|nr:hypothetical protein DFH06DRAFT_261453 [Mycena polygramma]
MRSPAISCMALDDAYRSCWTRVHLQVSRCVVLLLLLAFIHLTSFVDSFDAENNNPLLNACIVICLPTPSLPFMFADRVAHLRTHYLAHPRSITPRCTMHTKARSLVCRAFGTRTPPHVGDKVRIMYFFRYALPFSFLPPSSSIAHAPSPTSPCATCDRRGCGRRWTYLGRGVFADRPCETPRAVPSPIPSPKSPLPPDSLTYPLPSRSQSVRT